MEKYALIVEGKGDVSSAASLLAKVAAAFGQRKCACDQPIRAGEAMKLRRPGELERHLTLAASREDATAVVLLVDLDDGCASNFAVEFQSRAKSIEARFKKPVYFCFAVKEFEGWFLDSLASIRNSCPEHGIDTSAYFDDGSAIRGAKEALSAVCKARGYKQMRDQLLFSKKIDVFRLVEKNRSFRKFVKCVTGLSYTEILAAAGAAG